MNKKRKREFTLPEIKRCSKLYILAIYLRVHEELIPRNYANDIDIANELGIFNSSQDVSKYKGYLGVRSHRLYGTLQEVWANCKKRYKLREDVENYLYSCRVIVEGHERMLKMVDHNGKSLFTQYYINKNTHRYQVVKQYDYEMLGNTMLDLLDKKR